MNWFKKIPHTRRADSGLEWTLWKKLPLIALVGTLLPLVWLAGVHLMGGDSPEPAEARWMLMIDYALAGLITFHWSMVMTVGIGCFIVMLMKGPAYLADGYPLPHSDQPRSAPETSSEAIAYRPPDF